MDNNIVTPISQLFQVEPISFELSQAFIKLGITPKDLEDVGITVSVPVPYPMWCSEKEAIKLNKQAYESISEHRELFDFITLYGFKDLEELNICPYSSNYLWIRIADRKTIGKNRLIITHGPAPDRKEAYYRAQTYEEFWDVVKRLTDMYNYPRKDHTPITLYKNNGMIGNSYKEWSLLVK